MSIAQDFVLWDYEPDVYDYWNLSSPSMLSSVFSFPPSLPSLSDELPDHHKFWDSSILGAEPLIL